MQLLTSTTTRTLNKETKNSVVILSPNTINNNNNNTKNIFVYKRKIALKIKIPKNNYYPISSNAEESVGEVSIQKENISMNDTFSNSKENNNTSTMILQEVQDPQIPKTIITTTKSSNIKKSKVHFASKSTVYKFRKVSRKYYHDIWYNAHDYNQFDINRRKCVTKIQNSINNNASNNIVSDDEDDEEEYTILGLEKYIKNLNYNNKYITSNNIKSSNEKTPMYNNDIKRKSKVMIHRQYILQQQYYKRYEAQQQQQATQKQQAEQHAQEQQAKQHAQQAQQQHAAQQQQYEEHQKHYAYYYNSSYYYDPIYKIWVYNNNYNNQYNYNYNYNNNYHHIVDDSNKGTVPTKKSLTISSPMHPSPFVYKNYEQNNNYQQKMTPAA